MRKESTITDLVPQNIQAPLLFTTIVAYIAIALNVALLLVRAYPNGMRLSEFSIMAVATILMPLIFAMFTFWVFRMKKLFSRENLSVLSLVATLGIITQTALVGAYYFTASIIPLTVPSEMSHNLISLAVFALAPVLLFSGYLYYVARHLKSIGDIRSIQVTNIAIIALGFVAAVVPRVAYAINQYQFSGSLINVIVGSGAIETIILPAIFFATAWYLLRLKMGRLERLYNSALYTLVGTLIAISLINLTSVGLSALSGNGVMIPHQVFNFQPFFIAAVSLVIYVLIVKRTMKQSTTI